MSVSSQLCPCGSTYHYDDCCASLHNNLKNAATPEALMRSRFAAFALEQADYLAATWHPSKQGGEHSAEALKQSFGQTRWTRLEVIAAPTARGGRGEVEFAAFYQQADGQPGQLHERSRFQRHNGRWYYLDGKLLPAVKLGRNSLCWCGSGKKLKACHPG